MAAPLLLEDAVRSAVLVQPVVVFTIMDHFMRRGEDQESAFGLCFSTPFHFVVYE